MLAAVGPVSRLKHPLLCFACSRHARLLLTGTAADAERRQLMKAVLVRVSCDCQH